jgi:Uma2 family endonuclease
MDFQVKTTSTMIPLPRRSEEIYYPESDGKPMAETDIHAKLLMYLISSLRIFFTERENVYVTGNIMFYYEEGSLHDVVSPDVMVFFGVPKGDRTSYKSWEENDVMPSVVIELASRSTWHKDRTEKRELYEMLGVKEYYIFNPQYPKTLPAFMAFNLGDGELKKITIENNRVYSDLLELELVDTGETLRLFNPQTEEFLKNAAELTLEVFQANQEISQVNKENENLRAEIERLKSLLKN